MSLESLMVQLILDAQERTMGHIIVLIKVKFDEGRGHWVKPLGLGVFKCTAIVRVQLFYFNLSKSPPSGKCLFIVVVVIGRQLVPIESCCTLFLLIVHIIVFLIILL